MARTAIELGRETESPSCLLGHFDSSNVDDLALAQRWVSITVISDPMIDRKNVIELLIESSSKAPATWRKLWDSVSEALGIMTDAIVENDGVVGDFQGDAAMGFWGWPFDRRRSDRAGLPGGPVDSPALHAWRRRKKGGPLCRLRLRHRHRPTAWPSPAGSGRWTSSRSACSARW